MDHLLDCAAYVPESIPPLPRMEPEPILAPVKRGVMTKFCYRRLRRNLSRCLYSSHICNLVKRCFGIAQLPPSELPAPKVVP